MEWAGDGVFGFGFDDDGFAGGICIDKDGWGRRGRLGRLGCLAFLIGNGDGDFEDDVEIRRFWEALRGGGNGRCIDDDEDGRLDPDPLVFFIS